MIGKILLVEDDRELAEITADMLREGAICPDDIGHQSAGRNGL